MKNLSGLKSLEEYIDAVDYDWLNNEYIPSAEAIEFINFLKLVNGTEGESHKTPPMHLHMIDSLVLNNNCLYVVFRGAAKTTVLHEYMFLYLATYGRWFNFGEVSVAMFISDTMENGVRSFRKNLEHRWTNSAFLQKYVPYAKFTEDEWTFINADGHEFSAKGFGAASGCRGYKRKGVRPQWCSYDDLLSDKNAKSPTILQDIEDVVYKSSRQAMDPTRRKFVWSGTPFNKGDSLYKAAGSKGWATRAYPVCERFPCEPHEFKAAWPDRFTYDFIKSEHEMLDEIGKIQAFNQELMLRIVSDEDRLILDGDIQWYSRSALLHNRSAYNFYITTDFATSEKESADFSVIEVWGFNSAGKIFLVDGICARQTMEKNIDALFRLAQQWKPLSVGIEVTGQQGGFIPWIQREMITRNIWFNLASENNASKAGIRPVSNKLVRFQTVVPWFKAHRFYFPLEWRHTHPLMIELEDELTYVSRQGFKSAHDDASDAVSMLSVMPIFFPSEEVKLEWSQEDKMWQDILFAPDDQQDTPHHESYIV